MKREHTKIINNILDYCLPPIIRESTFFYRTLLSFFTKDNAEAYLNFRDNAWKMTDAELQEFYKSNLSFIKRPTDCNNKTIEKIIHTIKLNKYHSVLEFGCGRGYLGEKIINNTEAEYCGIDFDTDRAEKIIAGRGKVYCGNNLSIIPENNYFECILSTHTMEHVADLREIFNQMLEKSTKHVLLVVPLQLNLKYTPDFHMRFWRRPGDFFLDIGIKPHMNPQWEIISGDLYVLVEANKE